MTGGDKCMKLSSGRLSSGSIYLLLYLAFSCTIIILRPHFDSDRPAYVFDSST